MCNKLRQITGTDDIIIMCYNRIVRTFQRKSRQKGLLNVRYNNYITGMLSQRRCCVTVEYLQISACTCLLRVLCTAASTLNDMQQVNALAAVRGGDATSAKLLWTLLVKKRKVLPEPRGPIGRWWTLFLQPSAKHQLMLQNHKYRASASRTVPVLYPAFAGTKLPRHTGVNNLPKVFTGKCGSQACTCNESLLWCHSQSTIKSPFLSGSPYHVDICWRSIWSARTMPQTDLQT